MADIPAAGWTAMGTISTAILGFLVYLFIAGAIGWNTGTQILVIIGVALWFLTKR